MLNLDLARRTESFFVEWPNRLLTVAVPTDFQLKRAWSTQGSHNYALYRKTEWPIVPKILSERIVPPADWTNDNKGAPNQYPSYGPFGMAVEVGSAFAPLQPYPANQLSNGLFTIWKGQLSVGIIGFFQCPQMKKHQAGGNDQVQRGAMLNGGSKNDHATVARSDILTVAYAATTQVLPFHCMSWEYHANPDDSRDAPPRGREDRFDAFGSLAVLPSMTYHLCWRLRILTKLKFTIFLRLKDARPGQEEQRLQHRILPS